MQTLFAHADRLARSPSRRLLAILLSWIAGIASGSMGVPPHSLIDLPFLSLACATFAVIVLATVISRRAPVMTLILLCALVAILATARFAAAERAIAPFPAPSYSGIASADPDHAVRGVTVRADHVTDGQGRRLSVHAFTLRIDASEAVRAGDRLSWTCQDDPSVFAVFASCTAHHLDASPPEGGIDAWASSLRRRIRAAARVALPEPDASLALGLVIGERDGIPADIKATYRDAGVSHILAVSGSNVGWVVLVASYGLAAVFVRRRRALGRLLLAIIGFAILVGGDAPVVRATVVASAALVAEAFGRKGNTTNALALAAAGMLALDPLLIRDSVAFRLSFVAVIGLHALAAPLEKEFTRVPKDFGLRRALAETAAASFATLPIVLHDFGRFPTATLLANALIVPVMPSLVAVGALAIAAAALWPPLSLPFSTAFAVASRSLNDGIAAIVRVLPAFDLHIGTAASAALYGAIVALCMFLHRRTKVKEELDEYA